MWLNTEHLGDGVDTRDICIHWGPELNSLGYDIDRNFQWIIQTTQEGMERISLSCCRVTHEDNLYFKDRMANWIVVLDRGKKGMEGTLYYY